MYGWWKAPERTVDATDAMVSGFIRTSTLADQRGSLRGTASPLSGGMPAVVLRGGARLRELRTEAGLNGKDMADRLGRQRSVSRLEHGKQTPSHPRPP